MLNHESSEGVGKRRSEGEGRRETEIRMSKVINMKVTYNSKTAFFQVGSRVHHFVYVN
jgi:hypothetical protein